MDNRDVQILNKIMDELEYLNRLLEGVQKDEFLEDETVQRAATMSSINIGELAKRLSKSFYNAHPDSELKYAAKTRDVYAHGYYSLSFETVFKTAKEDYPRLICEIKKYLKED